MRRRRRVQRLRQRRRVRRLRSGTRRRTEDGWATLWQGGLAKRNPPLRREHSPSDGLRQEDRTEERLRIEVILAGLIDDPQHIVLLGGCIAQRYVDFAFLKRDRIIMIVHADDQLFCLCLYHGLKVVEWRSVIRRSPTIKKQFKPLAHLRAKLAIQFFEKRQSIFVDGDVVVQQLAVKFHLRRLLEDRMHHAGHELTKI